MNHDLLRDCEGLLARNELRRAEVAVARALRTSPDLRTRVALLLLRARARLNDARPAEALDDLQAVLKLEPQRLHSPGLLELRGDCHLVRYELASVGFADHSDTVAAAGCYERILRVTPNYENVGRVYFQLGRLALIGNDVAMARERFLTALLAPSHMAALSALCFERLGYIALYEERSLPRALGLLDKAIATLPVDGNLAWLIQVHLLRSRVLHEQQNYPSAIAAAETAVSLAASEPAVLAEALLTLAEFLAGAEGRQQEVIRHLQHYLQITQVPPGQDVTWARVHELLGDAWFGLGHNGEAVAAWLEALHYNPDNPWSASVQHRIARSLYQQGDYQAAAQAIEGLLIIAEGESVPAAYFQLYFMLGHSRLRLGNYHGARYALEQALKLAPAGTEGLEQFRSYQQQAMEWALQSGRKRT